MCRNWSAHGTVFNQDLPEALLAYVMLINLRAMFNLQSKPLQPHELILLRVFDLAPNPETQSNPSSLASVFCETEIKITWLVIWLAFYANTLQNTLQILFPQIMQQNSVGRPQSFLKNRRIAAIKETAAFLEYLTSV